MSTTRSIQEGVRDLRLMLSEFVEFTNNGDQVNALATINLVQSAVNAIQSTVNSATSASLTTATTTLPALPVNS